MDKKNYVNGEMSDLPETYFCSDPLPNVSQILDWIEHDKAIR